MADPFRLIKVLVETIVTWLAVWFITHSFGIGVAVCLVPLALGLANIFPKIADVVTGASLILAVLVGVTPGWIKAPIYQSAHNLAQMILPHAVIPAPSAPAPAKPPPVPVKAHS